MKATIGFYGAGNMTQAIIAGLLSSEKVSTEDIFVYNHRYQPTLEKVEKQQDIQAVLNEKDLFEKADQIIFAVKPAILLEVLPKIKALLTKEHLVISIASGVSIAQITQAIGSHKIIRVMPNTPAMVGEAMSAISVNDKVSSEETQEITKVFRSFGKAEVVPETLISAVVGVSGSAPAYVYLFIESLADGAVAEGMPRKEAYEFASQTVLGAAKMVLQTNSHPGELKDAVSSPGGTMIAAIEPLGKSHFRASVIEAVRTATKKDREMSRKDD